MSVRFFFCPKDVLQKNIKILETNCHSHTSDLCKQGKKPAEREAVPRTSQWKTAQNTMKKETLGQLIIDSEETMYHIAKSLLYNDEDCADAIQEAIVKAFSKLHTLKDDSYARTWLIRIVMNECYTIMRREKKIISLEEYQMDGQAAEQKDYSDLYEAIFKLPEQMKLCVTLYYMEGYSVKEVAALLDTTESAVKNRLAKARGKLKGALAE